VIEIASREVIREAVIQGIGIAAVSAVVYFRQFLRVRWNE